MDRQQEVKKFLEEVQIKGIKHVIFPESFFFLPIYSPSYQGLEDQSEVFKDFHFFTHLVQNIIVRDIKVHIQTNPTIQRKLDRISIMEILSDMSAIYKRKISDSLMFYHDINVNQIASRLIKGSKPSFGVKVLSYGVKTARNLLTFNRKDKTSHNGVNRNEIAIILNSSFSSAKREELFLGNFQTIELTILPKKSQARVDSRVKTSQNHKTSPIKNIDRVNNGNIPNPKIVNNNISQNKSDKHLAAKYLYDEALQIYNQLRDRTKEFSQSAVELKIKSDHQRDVLKNIDSMIAKNISDIDTKDLQDARMQCIREIKNYDQQCKDFFDLYVQINEQAKEAKQDLDRAEIELKKYSN